MPNRSETNWCTTSSSSWLSRCPPPATLARPLSAPPAAPRRGRPPPGLLETQGGRPALAKGGGPSSDGVRIPPQGLRRTRSRPSLGQQPDGVPSFPPRGVGARIRRRCKSLASICHCSRNQPISLTPITNLSLTPIRANQIYRITLRISPWLWFRRPIPAQRTSLGLGWVGPIQVK